MFLTQEKAAEYDRNGYLLVENMFTAVEVSKMIEAVEKGERVAARTSEGITDSAGKQARFANWKELGEDIWSAASSSPRIVNAARILIGEVIVFFGGKIIFTEARSGGAWEWHQAYGYWYTGCAYPNMLSVFVALDPSTRENGCLKVLKGSHKAGRLQHQKAGDGGQIEADPARITRLEGLHETVHSNCKLKRAAVYVRRRSERSAAYQVVRENLETWLAQRRAGRRSPAAGGAP